MRTKGKVLIAGGSGFTGLNLATRLKQSNYDVAILSRSKQNNSDFRQFIWNVENDYIQREALQKTDYIINLAGENISDQRWTRKQKRKILESRVRSTELLFKAIQNLEIKPKAYIAASATGYYGSETSNDIFTEQDSNGTDFLAKVCNHWEKASLKIKELGVRTVILRTGVVFDKKNGAFPKMTKSLKFGIVTGVGTGDQYIPWIHIDDLTDMYLFSIEQLQIHGIFNAVAPDHLNQNQLKQYLSKHTGKLILPNLPTAFTKAIFGQMSSILLNGSRISSEKICKMGFTFKHPQFIHALNHLIL